MRRFLLTLAACLATTAYAQDTPSEAELAERLLGKEQPRAERSDLAERLSGSSDANSGEPATDFGEKDGKFTVAGAERVWSQCPDWQDNAYGACECEASVAIADEDAARQRKRRIAWRTTCGVVASREFSDPFSSGQLLCERSDRRGQKIEAALADAGVSAFSAEANKAVELWNSNLGCVGADRLARREAPKCSVGWRIYADDASQDKIRRIDCPDGSSKTFTVSRLHDFVFRIRGANGEIATVNAKKNFDPDKRTYYIDAGFVAGAMCQKQPDANFVASLASWIEEEAKSIIGEDRPGASVCVGVRG